MKVSDDNNVYNLMFTKKKFKIFPYAKLTCLISAKCLNKSQLEIEKNMFCQASCIYIARP